MTDKIMQAKLKEYGAYTLEGIKEIVPKKEPYDYLYKLVLDYPNRGGKGFRPSLCIASCNAHGGKMKDAKLSAIALELLHNAFLVHDDVEDESYYRRSQPTMHQSTSKAIAINVGDAMNALSLHPLFQNRYLLGAKLSRTIFLEMKNLITESTEGQAIELGWRHENKCDLVEADYLRMILKKTCWYTCMHPIRIGAIIGSKGREKVEKFNQMGFFMGASFQIQDDVLNLVANEQEYGKEIAGDIIEGKRTLMLIHLFEHSNLEELQFIKNFLSKPILERSHTDASSILSLMKKYQSIEHGVETSQYLAGAALKEFYTHFSHLPDSEDKSFIEHIILYMINRKY